MTRSLSLRPRSLSGLILLGFVAVALPLLFGTINAAVEMRNLSTASERLVTNGVAATQYTQAIVRQVSSLERTARLHQILRRPALLDTFRQNHQLLIVTLDGLERLPGDPDRAVVIEHMRATTDAIETGSMAQAKAWRTRTSSKGGRVWFKPMNVRLSSWRVRMRACARVRNSARRPCGTRAALRRPPKNAVAA